MIIYSLHVALLLAIYVVFYKLLLQKETYYKLNRAVLLLCLVMAFALPLIPVPAALSLRSMVPTENVLETEAVPQNLPEVKAGEEIVLNADETVIADEALASLNVTPEIPLIDKIFQWAFWIYWCGVIILGANLLLQLIVLFFQGYKKPVIKDGIYRIVELDGDKAPCSFGNTIYINPAKYDWETYNQILTHEKVHIQQGHSFDLMLAELVLVFQWFNPFAWLYRKELESNLEFLTDDSVLYKHHIAMEEYQMSLLKVSVPNLSMNITTNYNQSLLKKRIVMMNAKKSNVHIMWKYFILVPLLVSLVCILNKPFVQAMDFESPNTAFMGTTPLSFGGQAKGLWSATISGDKVNVECKSDNADDRRNYSNVSPGNGIFKINEFTNLPKTTKADFAVSREAGTVIFNGKFDDNLGFGRYKFSPNKTYKDFLAFKNIDNMDEDDYFAFFIQDIKKSYIQFLNDKGYTRITKDQVLALSTHKVDGKYLDFWQANGIENVTVNQLISLKRLKIDSVYLSDIRHAGYKEVTIAQLINFKEKNITPAYISGMRRAKTPAKAVETTATTVNIDEKPTVSEIIKSKSMNIDTSFVAALRDIGYHDLSTQTVYNLKTQGITAAFIKSYMDIGMKNPTVNTLYNLKTQKLTAAYIKEFYDIGLKDITLNSLYNLRAQGISAAYIKSFQDIGMKDISSNTLYNYKTQQITAAQLKAFMDVGFRNLSLTDLYSLKTNKITPEQIKAFQKLGFQNITVKEIIYCKNNDLTPAFIADMKKKGFNSNVLSKYVQLKSFNSNNGQSANPKNF
ncbi:MAG: M56 family metallopeptidase [Pedobacter sp.]|nr:MAG: M56 family metallopeptidase [Pedobacter sp.]